MVEHHLRLRLPLGAAFICAAFVLLVVSAYGLASRAYAQSSSRLLGQVFNGTGQAPPEGVSNLEVTLFQMGASGPLTQTVRTDAQGRFAFGDLKLDPNSPYFANVNYKGIHYFSDTMTPGVEASTPLSLTVYETQTIPANFQIDRTHFILDQDQNSLTGIELIQVHNPTDRAFVLPLPLPQNLSALQFNDPRDQSRAIQNADGSIAFPILPTTDQVLLGVRMITTPPDYTLKVDTPIRVGQMNVLVSQTGGLQVSSPQLTAGPPFTPASGSSYWQLNGSNIPAGSTVAVVISNLPGGDNMPTIRNVVLGLGGIGALALLALPFARRRIGRLPSRQSTVRREGEEAFVSSRGASAESEAEEGLEGSDISKLRERGATASDRLARLEAIADLDDTFEAGEIPEDEYRAQRATLKSELMHDPNPQA